jgi:hypothetical protein
MYLLYVQRHCFMAISDPEVRSSGRVNNAVFTVLRIGGGGSYTYNAVWITVVQDRAN